MSRYTSIHGRVLGFNSTHLLFNNRPVGNDIVGRGRTFYVDSAINATGGESPDEAVGTLDEAFALCTANRGDTIVVLPNHAETVTGAGGVTHDVAGVSVIGLGVGNQRPRILLDGGTAVTYLVSAADAYIENLVLAAGHSDVVTCFNVTATDCTINRCEFVENTTNENFLVCVLASGADNTADGLTVTNCTRITADVGATDFVSGIGSIDRLTVNDNFYCADAATAAGLILTATGKVLTGLQCMRNLFVCGNTAGDLLIDNDVDTNTGIAAYNLVGHHDAAAMIAIDCDGIRLFENYSTDADTTSGALIPAASSIT